MNWNGTGIVRFSRFHEIFGKIVHRSFFIQSLIDYGLIKISTIYNSKYLSKVFEKCKFSAVHMK